MAWLAVLMMIFAGVVISEGAFVSEELSISQQKNETLTTLFEILFAIYDEDVSLIPIEPNEISALEYSSDSRDQVAWAIFNLIRAEMDPNFFSAKEFSTSFKTVPVEVITTAAVKEAEAEIFPTADTTDGVEMGACFAMESAQELSGPLDSCVLEPGTYHITKLPLQIEGHVVIPAGVRLIAPFDPNSTIIEVMPGGLLDTGKAAFYTDEDDPNILPPVEIVPQEPNAVFNHNAIGIYIHRGADPKTRIENVIIQGCSVGILVDESLVNPIQGVITVGCYDGMHLYAPAGVVNCEFWYNGSVWDGVFGYVGTGIFVYPDIVQYPNPVIEISQIVTYAGDVGIYFGTMITDPNLVEPSQMVAHLNIVNSGFAWSFYCGIYKAVEEGIAYVQYSAFCINQEGDVNFDGSFTGCLSYPDYDPFYNRPEDWRKIYVSPGSGLIDAGYGIATDGTGVYPDRPDTGPLDIGCHFALGLSGGFGLPSSPADFNWDGIVDEADLELMNMCMGAESDPNIVKLDTNYDSRVNLPDFGILATDWGYCGDPNFCTNNDPNCQRSDFNGDDWVDITDFAILAELWLVPVFDEYRICSLCNLSPTSDPNLPEVIDANDMAVFMADWGKEYTFEPNIVIEQSASNVSVSVENPTPAWRISAFLDEEMIGQWDEDGMGVTAFDADLTQYGPGSHRLKIVRNIDYGLEITEQVITDPNTTGLYFADIPDTFEPNEPYVIRGFNLGDELNVKINNIWDEPIYDVNVPFGAVNLQVSSEAIGSNQICTLSMAAGSNVVTSDLVKTFDPNEWPNGARMVIVVTEWRIWRSRRPAILACAQACDNRYISWVPLYRKNVTEENLTYLLPRQTTRYVYWCGHGNSVVGDISRTFTMSWKQTVRNWWWDAWERIPVFSFTNRSLQGYPTLPDNWDNKGFDLWTLGMHDEPDKWIVFVDACQSAVYEDMARAYGIFNSGNNNQIYIGWRADITVNGVKETFSPRNFEKYTSRTNPAIVRFWEKMGSGRTVQQALQATAEVGVVGGDAVIALWGPLMDVQIGNENGDDTIFVYGDGLTNHLSNAN